MIAELRIQIALSMEKKKTMGSSKRIFNTSSKANLPRAVIAYNRSERSRAIVIIIGTTL